MSPSRLEDDSRIFYDISFTTLPEIYRQSLVRRPVSSLVRLLVRPWPDRVAPSARESSSAHICPIPCSLSNLTPSHVHSYPHCPPANVANSEHQSTPRIHVPSEPFGLAEQGLLLEHFSLSNFFRHGERLEFIRF